MTAPLLNLRELHEALSLLQTYEELGGALSDDLWASTRFDRTAQQYTVPMVHVRQSRAFSFAGVHLFSDDALERYQQFRALVSRLNRGGTVWPYELAAVWWAPEPEPDEAAVASDDACEVSA